jgi:hypothetical protein
LRHRRRLAPSLLALTLGFAALSSRAETLHIRLLRASHAEGPVAPALQDVMPALRNSLVFKSYTLMDQAQQPLPPPAGASVSLGGYSVACTGPATQLSIKITRGRHGIIDTVATLRRGQPLILGGFGGGGGGQAIFVFTLQ